VIILGVMCVLTFIYMYEVVCRFCVVCCLTTLGFSLLSCIGISTDYGLDGPGSNLGGDEIFRPSRPALRPTQPPVQWVPGLPRG